MTERLVVIGGDAGGMAAASQVRRMKPDTEILVIEKGDHTSYSMCGIPYFVAGEVDAIEDLVARSPEEFRAQDIEVRTRTEATALDLDARTVETRDVDFGTVETLGFDQLMIGTGARPVVPDWADLDHPRMSVAHTLPDAERLAEMAEDCADRHVVVVGGGYVGVEMAEAYVARKAEVTLVTRGAHLVTNLDPELSRRIEELADRDGIDVQLGRAVQAVDGLRVVTAAGDELDADIVILAMGVQPNTELFADAGLDVGIDGALVVDDHQRAHAGGSPAEGIYAAGDCCEVFHRISRRPAWIPLGTTANKASRVAGVNLAGGDSTFGGVLGTAITRLCRTEISRTGLNLAQATEAGFDPVATDVETTTRSAYFPGADEMVIRLVHDRGTGQVLGAQIVGGSGAAKRIDTVAAALWGGLTLEEMVDLDLAYAPPFSSVWDPVNVVAKMALRK